MPQALDEHDRDDDDRDDFDEDLDQSDQDSDTGAANDGGETIPCPFCRKSIHEDADICRHCGNYIGGEDAPRRVPALVWVGLILAAVCVLTWLIL